MMRDNSRVYENFLEYRRKETSNFIWISRQLYPQLAFKQGKCKTIPAHHKKAVLQSPKIQELLETLSQSQNVSKSQLEEQVRNILDEIGYNKKLTLIRWLGLLLTKICLKVCSGILVNAGSVQRIKSVMGTCPVVFVPSHRSYADFILMSFVCFNYDIAIPAIAAGMDFQGMFGMGEMLRDTGAFFMRRSYNDDALYWTTFKQYVYQIVSNGDLPIEFFIEGTRSRTNKSLTPKFGFMAMILKAFFLSQVPDVLFVPISINYDRILEESLFAFELLGIPKPKETTSGFFKSLKIIKENFGNIYIHFSEPISCKAYFGSTLDRSVHNLKPLHQQEITDNEKALIPPLSYEILNAQQKNNVLSGFNLMSLVLNSIFSNGETCIDIQRLAIEMRWMISMLNTLGAYFHQEDVTKAIEDALNVHKNLLRLSSDGKVSLVSNDVILDKFDSKKLKGHLLSDKTMTYSVPFITLQIYVNPCLQYLIDYAMLFFVLQRNETTIMDEGQLYEEYRFLRTLLAKEFVSQNCGAKEVFDVVLSKSMDLNLISISDGGYTIGTNKKLENILLTNFIHFMISYKITMDTIQNLPIVCDEKTILANTQKILEEKINTTANEEQFLHPYCLNLDTLSNCIGMLCEKNVLKKQRRDNKNICETNLPNLFDVREKLNGYITKFYDLTTRDETKISQLQNKL